uniref:Matrix-remodeling-associated protein 7 helical domain-containing protein n=1 Tax=Oncorhynchus mykiss TaxID=8022 RepID=A0A8K9XAM7_ONCMY
MTTGIQTAPREPFLSADMEVVEVPLKYVPGMLRTSQMEKMMTKEELEEEQRVQREQLAAIFQLLKENQETFGEVSEGDVEEQLRLYSI